MRRRPRSRATPRRAPSFSSSLLVLRRRLRALVAGHGFVDGRVARDRGRFFGSRCEGLGWRGGRFFFVQRGRLFFGRGGRLFFVQRGRLLFVQRGWLFFV